MKKNNKTPKLRFSGYTDDWEQRKLGDLVDRVTRKNQDLVSELPLTISAQYGLIDQNEFFDKRVASKDVSGYYLIENGEFAYNKSTSTDAPWGAIKRLDRYENVNTARIKGVERFGDCQYSIIPDQIEAGTFMTAAVATKGDIMIKNVIPKHLEAISAKLIEIGAEVVEFDDAVRVSATKRLESTNIKTLPYPGFPTDMQPQMAVTLALSNGTSVISESIFENRFRYVDELTKMGATIQVDGRTAIISGVEGFTGADVHAPDLRAGAALVIAGLSAKGFTTVSDIGYIYRGYEQFEQKLKQLGGEIQLVNNEKEVAKFKLKIG